jgi:hypothetical protein
MPGSPSLSLTDAVLCHLYNLASWCLGLLGSWELDVFNVPEIVHMMGKTEKTLGSLSSPLNPDCSLTPILSLILCHVQLHNFIFKMPHILVAEGEIEISQEW